MAAPEEATHESKELARLRNSVSFKLGIVITNLFKKPWRIPLLPIDIIRIFSKPKHQLIDVVDEDLLIA